MKRLALLAAGLALGCAARQPVPPKAAPLPDTALGL